MNVSDLGETVRLPISKIKPAPDNPRKIPQRAVEIVGESLKRFGWQQPLVVDKDLVIIAGHTRLLAAKELGVKDVPVIVAENLTPDEVKAFRIADNRTHDFTTWDYPQLVEQLDYLADDFSDVLALDDWQSIADSFDTSLDVTDGLGPRLDPNSGFHVTVVFKDERSALEAGPHLLDIPGVIDVRHKRGDHAGEELVPEDGEEVTADE